MTHAVGMSMAAPAAPSQRAVAHWLLVCCAMVFVMVILGGLTRLTHSGLSMVEWQPHNFLPPLSEAEWRDTFARYQQFPEFQKVNQGMDLAGFKGIFWLEYVHRLWGRTIGIVFLVPFLWFLWRGAVTRGLAPKLAGIFVLGGLQGALGWFMVASGLVDNPDVSHYRLAAHLLAAFLIYGVMLWVALGLLHPQAAARGADQARLGRRLSWLTALATVTILWGAFVAGLDAGFIYNTFPLMGEGLWPGEILEFQPWPLNFVENMSTVQFTHRVLAVALFALILVTWMGSRSIELEPRARVAMALVPVTATFQLALGIATLLLAVPVSLASAHQGGALVLLTALVWAIHELRPGRPA